MPVRRAARLAVIASSRSAAAPVRSKRDWSASCRLASRVVLCGSSGALVSTAARPAVTASSRSAAAPVDSYRVCSAAHRLDSHRG